MNRAVVLFSGGIDSAYLALKSAPLYDELILNTYLVPGMINVKFSKKAARQLAALFGKKITHNIIDIRRFVYSIKGNAWGCLRDNLKYGFYCSWCLGCRLAMHLYTISFCKENGIRDVLEGSNLYDSESLAQNEDVINAIRKIYEEEGVELKTPFYYEENTAISKSRLLSLMRRIRAYKDSTAARVVFLKKNGINPGRGFYSTYRSTQPSCLTSVCFNAPKALLVNFRKEDREGYLKYIFDKVSSWRRKNK